jgi:hypothetical protein
MENLKEEVKCIQDNKSSSAIGDMFKSLDILPRKVQQVMVVIVISGILIAAFRGVAWFAGVK